MKELNQIEKQIAALKVKRDKLIRESGIEQDRLQAILKMRSPNKTLCQLLRELHKTVDDIEREKVEQCLLIAKKMSDKLIEYAGKSYTKDWYDQNGNLRHR